MIFGKITISCLVIVFAMKILGTVYHEIEHKAPPDWFKVFGGLVIVVGFVSFVIASFMLIWA
jgi:flagellar biogenesis protein FliO